MGAVKRDRGDAFLNSIIRFWENRVAVRATPQLPSLQHSGVFKQPEEWSVQDALEAAENDKKLGVKDLTTVTTYQSAVYVERH